MNYTFEDKYSEIVQEIEKYRAKWNSTIDWPSIDYDDVSQQLLLHIWKKWRYWNQNISLKKWLRHLIYVQTSGYYRTLPKRKINLKNDENHLN